ncbi:CHASE2 domain-containing serine/threonine-protein kinase [Cyanobacterium aponinum AL20118]|uniref:non-specific serine/threonine protein kinase n=1 Tax=Cyanobacterium aponinum AL20115 TaxID=3090662 RepID=A0AAF1C280_9CHRO|nr:CHASE2 domain-containing serine/threonine-protein kinase [Cyanobacterium aponinum]WPF89437.1 CHASE2 domain-containing serine/threonine-protein kinase [Cyanobacterium aponinum AL20115]
MATSFSQWLNQKSWRKTSFAVISASVIASTLTVILKQGGGFEYFDLGTYDKLIRLRLAEKEDNRILTVLITEDDIQAEGKWPISDATLAKSLNNLLQHNPYGIGIDLYRDLPVEPGAEKLKNIFSVSNNISAVCKLESQNQPAVSPPSTIAMDLVGFADIVIDGDGVVRRNLFYVDPQESRCPTPYSLGLQMALSYLMAEGIEPEITEDGLLKLGKTTLKPLNQTIGAYQNIDANGYQIMIDYRRGDKPTPTVTLNEVLQGNVSPELITNKIIFMGVSAPSLKDTFYTPFSRQGEDMVLMPGVTLHSYMTSQILTSAIDGQPLIWSWQEWQEILWIYFWGLIGSCSILFLSRPLVMILGQGVAIVIIVGSAVIISFWGGWIPIISPLFAFFGGAIALVSYNAYQAKQEQLTIQKQVADQEKSIAMLQMLLENRSQITDAPSIINYEQGSLIVNRYEIVKALGKGSFGSTYLSRDLQRPGKPYCVVKRLTPSSKEPKFLKIVQRLFRTEAKILEKVGTHEKIPQLLAYIEENNEFFLIQEYIEGKTIMREIREKGKYREKDVLILIEEIMSILTFIQEYNLIHRDIKPDNIIRRNTNNSIVLIDFGAVKQISRKSDQKTVIIGNEGYAAPEQLAGQPCLGSDIYATGMLAIHCLTGNFPNKLPRDDKTGEIIWNSQEYVSRPTASIIKKMTRYHFSDRYQNAEEVMKDLRKFRQKIRNKETNN